MWRFSLLAGLPLVVLIVAWCLVPRPYLVGTDSVNALTPSTPIPSGTPACVGGLTLPAGTRRIQLRAQFGQPPVRQLVLTLRTPGGTAQSQVQSPSSGSAGQTPVSFPIPSDLLRGSGTPAAICLRAHGGPFALWGTTDTPALQPPLTIAGASASLEVAIRYLPRSGATRSYVQELGTMLDRAAIFAPGFASPLLFGLVILVLLPVLALLAIRCLAISVTGRYRRLALWLYVLAVLNAAAWSLITPPFQAPDELDHFAYVQSLAEQGQKPSPYPSSRQRWSSAELDALLATDMLTDHQANDTRAPSLPGVAAAYRKLVVQTHPRPDNGGGLQTTSGYGPLYYLAVAPGYLVAQGGSVFSQLELSRLISALIGALAALFAFLLVRELAPRRVWLATMAGLVVAFEPMYSFLSGALNNDIGVDAGGAAVAYLLVRLLRRGLDRVALAWLAVLLGALPIVKGSAFELYPLSALALAGAAWRERIWRPGARWPAALNVAGFVGLAGLVYAGCSALNNALTPAPPPVAGGGASPVATVSGSLSGALHHPLSYLEYLWEVFLPRLPGMTPHFGVRGIPAETIFIRRGWGAFGWYDILFPHWVYILISLITFGALVLGLVAIRGHRDFVSRRWPELALLVLFPVAVVAGFEAVFYTSGERPAIAEMGRYAFPALAPLAALAAGALYGFGRRRAIACASVLLVAVLAFSYASQLLTFTAFFS